MPRVESRLHNCSINRERNEILNWPTAAGCMQAEQNRLAISKGAAPEVFKASEADIMMEQGVSRYEMLLLLLLATLAR